LTKTSGGGLPAFKSGGSLFEKRLLPLVKERRVDALALAEFGDRSVFEQMQAQDAHLVGGAVLTASFLFHATGGFQVCPVAYPFSPSGHSV